MLSNKQSFRTKFKEWIYVPFIEKGITLELLIICVPLSMSLSFEGLGKISIPTEAVSFIVFGILLLSLIIFKNIDRKFWFHPITLLLLADILICIYTSAFSTNVFVSVKRLIIHSVFIGVYYFAFYLWFLKKGKPNRLYLLFGLGMIIPVMYSLVRHYNYGFSQNISFAIPQPFFNDHTIYAACIAFVLPFFMYWLFAFRKDSSRPVIIGFIVLFIILIIALILSFSRAAWVSAISVALFSALLIVRIKILHILALILVSGAVLFINSGRMLEDREISEHVYTDNIIEHFATLGKLQSDVSNMERVNRWVCSLRMFQEKPFTGFGPGTFQFEYAPYQSAEYMTRISTYKGDRGGVHSEYLSALVENGIAGFVQFTLLVFYSIHLGLRLFYKNKGNNEIRLVIYAALMGLVTFYVHALFNEFLTYDKMSILVYGSLCILVYIDLMHTNKSQVEQKFIE
jgi:putative inorganic carbon (hco3(-)) transporter